jgi:diphosphomevalonate decarboxylase
MTTATALANPNIAFVKYWGNRDETINIPSNGSISMNLDGLSTRTSVAFEPALSADVLRLNGRLVSGPALQRVSQFLDIVRKLARLDLFARVESSNDFPMGAGIASSASAFAALGLAASTAAGLSLSERDLSRLARRASGSACRSIPAGFVEWLAGEKDEDSFASSIAPPDYWELCDCIAVVSSEQKPTSSSEGHALANTSPLQPARLVKVRQDLELCRRAILARDFDGLAAVTELESNLMHAVMITSTPPLFYWQAASLAVMQVVTKWRKSGFPACYTLDAGPNVHVLCPADMVAQVSRELSRIPGVEQLLIARPGGPAHLVD